jgi:hypothetical protein
LFFAGRLGGECGRSRRKGDPGRRASRGPADLSQGTLSIFIRCCCGALTQALTQRGEKAVSAVEVASSQSRMARLSMPTSSAVVDSRRRSGVSNAQIAVIDRRLGERVKSTGSARSHSVPIGMHQKRHSSQRLAAEPDVPVVAMREWIDPALTVPDHVAHHHDFDHSSLRCLRSEPTCRTRRALLRPS